MNNYLSAKEVKERYKITNQTLYNWRNNDKIKFKRLPSGSILYYPLENVNSENELKLNVVYARVSNTKQKADLNKQISTISNYAVSNGFKLDLIFKDIASGMNENRADFNKMMKLVLERKVSKIFVSYKDRLTRFGFGYLDSICKIVGTEIIVLNSTKEEDFQSELTADLVSIIHHFSMKLYSKRRSELKTMAHNLAKD